jgi:hypothetical protein
MINEELDMSLEREGYLHDYIAAGLVGVAVGLSLFGAVVFYMIQFAAFSQWGNVIALGIVSGLFGYTSGGFVSGYLNFRLHKTEGTPMEGLGIGFVTFVVHLIVTLFSFVALAAVSGGAAGTIMTVWGISLGFALIFYLLGGYISGMLEHRTISMPVFLLFKGRSIPPPPPTPGAQTCPTCGGPLRYIEQYQRWYCNKEKKYV